MSDLDYLCDEPGRGFDDRLSKSQADSKLRHCWFSLSHNYD
jgi:hypothetical protein